MGVRAISAKDCRKLFLTRPPKITGIQYTSGVTSLSISFRHFNCKITEKDHTLDERESCD